MTTDMINYTTPEAIGISSDWLINYLMRLDSESIALHSAIIARHNSICMECYYTPYKRDDLHRMFSITKSFASLAIGLLADEGRISLDDCIVSYFPEKQPPSGPYEYTAMLTIRDMLTMRTCHNKTTYVINDTVDWVGSFFTKKPTHVPGTNYSYDTSSTHVLAALVEKLTGMSMLDYMRIKFLDEIGFSKNAYILTDPCGVSMGGSGLCATPMDILKVMMLIANNGVYNGKQLLPAWYLKEAITAHSDTLAKHSNIEEMQGYGYQIWSSRNNGYILYGMGGQLCLYLPDKDIYMMTTADTQCIQGGIQYIYNAFYDEVYDKVISDSLPADNEAVKRLENCVKSRALMTVDTNTSLTDDTPAIRDVINHRIYICPDNNCGVTEVSVDFNEDNSGTLTYTNKTGKHSISFLCGDNYVGVFPDYHMRYAASGAWRTPASYLIRVQIIDSAIGNIFITLSFRDDYITVMFRKVEESLFNEYNSTFSGRYEKGLSQ